MMNGKALPPLQAAIQQALAEARIARRTSSASVITLLALSATALPPIAKSADTYSANDETSLRTAITDANADGDPSATITLTADIALASTTAFSALTKPITINTNGFALNGQSGVMPGGPLTFSGNTLTLIGSGQLKGGNGADATTGSLTGGAAVVMTNGSVANSVVLTGGSGGNNNVNSAGNGGAGAVLTNSTLVNDGSITGGAGGNKTGGAGISPAGGDGARLTSSTLTNNGTLTGGRGGDGVNGGGSGGIGALLIGGTHLNNGTVRGGSGGVNTSSGAGGTSSHGAQLQSAELVNSSDALIEGGASNAGGLAGTGVMLQGNSKLTNAGTIRGGSGTITGTPGAFGNGVYQNNAGTSTIINTGTIEGTPGSKAIGTPSGLATVNLTVINSGVLRAGAGQTTAVEFSALANAASTLELQPGSVIEGNVVASSTNVNDTFRLGGAGADTFDVSGIGSKYTGFVIYEKNNTSTWTLTGTTPAVIPWQLNGGTLSVSSDANLGGAAGGLTLSGGTLQNTAAFTSARTIVGSGGTFQTDADLTLSGAISGTALTKTGAGTLIRTGTGAPAVWNLRGGTLSVSDVGQLGTTSTDIDGGTLRVTSPFTYNSSINLNGVGGIFQTDADLIRTATTSGAGALTKTGSATLTLAATINTWSGGTTISDGTLQIGNGGIAGALPGNAVNNATLAFNKTVPLTVDGLISGSGAVIQRGTGRTTLTGNNTYTGATNVDVGTLRINGDQSAATGLVSVANGATLGGSGKIGGAVTIADGGHLAPGNSPGTLSIGSLTLNAGSILDFELGEANAVGSTFNDLINVNGDLTLDGTLNVALSTGGTYGAGIYRLINYTGAITDNGLDLGLMPASSANYVQTSVANQVNLINTQGLVLGYWDGGTAARNDSQIGGGNGTWLAAGNDNWTTADAALNAQYQDGAMAIFGGTAGTITVDDSRGAINVSGLQFATNGYRLEGDAIGLGAGANAVRVGDGTDAGAGYTATIASQLSGAGTLDKTDLGTLVLTGTNSYTGGTMISAGTLQLGDGGTSGSLVGDITNNGALAFNRSDAFTLASVISGNGELRQIGSGTTTLSAAGSTASTLNVRGGTLEIAAGASLAANTTNVATGATLRNGGTFTGTAGDDTLNLAGTFIGSASFLDGNDQVQIAEAANFSQTAFDGGAGVDTLDIASNSALTLSPTLATGFENLVKRGTGALTLSGDVNGFSDSITLAGGSAQLANANIVTNQMNIESGVTVTGTGSLSGNLTNAGVLSPGNSPGTIHVAGNFTQAATGTLVSEITASGTDLIDVAGSATLGGIHQINVEYGRYLEGTTQTLIRANGGITGDFASVQMNSSVLMTSERQLTANAEAVHFERVPITALGGLSAGRARFASYLEEQIGAGNVDPAMSAYIDTLLQQNTVEGVANLLGERAEPVASVTQNSVSMLGAGFARTVFERFTLSDAAQCAPTQASTNDTLNCFWAHGLRQWGNASGDSRYDWTSNGGQFGLDRTLSSDWSVGATFGYADTDTHDPRGGRNETRSKMGGLYASYAPGRFNAGVMAFYSGNDNDTRRSVLVGGTPQQARAEFDSNSFGVGVRVGYRVTGESAPLVRPFVEAFYDHLERTQFGETDAGAGNLSANVHGRDGLRGTVGLQLADNFEGYGRVFRPALELGVAHQFADVRSTLDLQPFSDAPSFRTYGPELDRTSYLARASLNVSLGDNASVALGYGGELADDYSQHEGNLSFRMAW